MTSVKINLEFQIGDIVYMKVAPEDAGMVTGYEVRPTGVAYYVTWADAEEQRHFAVELTADKSFST